MARTKQPSSSPLAGRIAFPSLLKPTSGSHKSAPTLKTTLISNPLPLSNCSNANATKKENMVIKPRARSESTTSVDTIRPSSSQKPKVAVKPVNRKRARVESGVAESEAAPRTRQRLSSMNSDVVPKSAQDVSEKVAEAKDATIPAKPQEFQTRLRIPSNYRSASAAGPPTVLNIGRSQPAAAVLSHDSKDIVMRAPSYSNTVFVVNVPSTQSQPATPTTQRKSFAAKSPNITRRSPPTIPSRWDSNAFPVMKPGVLEYHNRFRDAELAKPKKELSTRIIPEGLLPPALVYEPEADDEFGEGDLHIVPPLTDHWGNILEVSARHLEMAIVLEEKNSFVEFWDLDHSDIVHVGVPVYLHFTLKVDNEDASTLNRAIPPRPDFRCMDITCESFEYHGKQVHATTNSSPEFTTKYYGATVGSSKTINPAYALTAGILLRRKWGKMFPAPNPRASNPSPPNSDNGVDDDPDSTEKTRDDQKKGWFLKMWVPIPIELFRRKESRAFRIKAAAWLGDEQSGGILTAETDMVLSHLRSHREMETL